jgi:hypothetical protein
MCVLFSTILTLLGKASKIWEVVRESIGSHYEVARKFFYRKFSIFLRNDCN